MRLNEQEREVELLQAELTLLHTQKDNLVKMARYVIGNKYGSHITDLAKELILNCLITDIGIVEIAARNN